MRKVISIVRVLGRFLLRLAGIAVVVALLAVLWLQTNSGRAWLLDIVETELRARTPIELSLQGLQKGMPFTLGLDRVTLSDTNGEWIVLEDLAVTPRYESLRPLRVGIDAVSAGSVHVLRRPASKGSASPPRLPELRLIDIGYVAIDELRLDGPVMGQPLAVRVAGGVVTNGVHARIVSRDANDSIGLSLLFTTNGLAVDATVSVASDSSWLDRAPLPTNMSGRLVATFVGVLRDVESGIGMVGRVDATASELTGLPAMIGATVRARATVGYLPHEGVALTDGVLSCDAGTAAVDGIAGPDHVQFAVSAESVIRGAAVSGHAVLTKTGGVVHVANLEVSHPQGSATAEFDVDLAAKRVVGNAVLHPVRIAPAEISATGSVALSGIDLEAIATNVSLAVVAPTSGFDGRGDVTLRLAGTLESPRIDLRASATATRTGLPEVVRATLHVVTEAGRATGSVVVAMGDLAKASADLSLPLSVSLAPPAASLLEGAAAGVDVKGTVDLSGLYGWLVPLSHRIAGRVVVDMESRGPWPHLEGQGIAKVVDGAYAYDAMGLNIPAIGGTLSVRDGNVVIESIAGNVSGGGTVSMTGIVALAGASGLTYRVDTRLRDAQLVRRDDIKAAVSGLLTVQGDKSGVDAGGELRLEDVSVLLERMRRRVEPSLEVVDGVPVAETKTSRDAKRPRLLRSCDIRVRMGERVSIKGYGLDSDWSGTMRLGRGDAEWSLSGRLDSRRRGTYTMLSRPFMIREGTIYFSGPMPPDPTLDVTAEYERADLVAIARITGRAVDPTFGLTSDPALPEDEILSTVLFGRSLSTITPFQGAQLALALNSMRGGQSPGMVTRARERIPVDELNIRQNDAGETDLVAGKNVSDRLYVELNRSLGGDRSSIVAEYELSPNWSIETDAGPSMRPGVGVNWKLNY